MQVYYCPIDTSLSFSQANILIRDLKPSHLVVAESYMSPPPLAPQRTDLVIEWVRRCFHFLLFIVYMHFPESGRGSGNSCFPVQNSDLGFHGQTEDIQYNIQYSVTLFPNVSTLISRGMFCGAKYTHHTFTPIIKNLITTTANKHPGKKSFVDKNTRKSHWHQAVHIT